MANHRLIFRNVKNINKMNEREAQMGIEQKNSWHNMYKHSAWVFVGGLNFELTEGDIVCVFSQYGEIVNINLIRDKKTGKSKGYGFLCYEDQRSTVLAVDNLNGIKLVGRIIRVDHVENYKMPKEHDDEDEVTKQLKNEGCAPKPLEVSTSPNRDHKAIKTEKYSSSSKHKKHKDKPDSPHRDSDLKRSHKHKHSRDDKKHKDKKRSKRDRRSSSSD